MSYPQPTAETQYAACYPSNGKDARENNITVRKAASRTYGYELLNTRLGERFAWYRYKRDAVQAISNMKGWN